MSNPGQLVVEDVGIYMYTHRDADDLEEVLFSAMEAGQSRWDQPDYMAKIIFEELSAPTPKDTGAGLSSIRYQGVHRTLRVDFQEELVKMESIYTDDEGYEKSLNDFMREHDDG